MIKGAITRYVEQSSSVKLQINDMGRLHSYIILMDLKDPDRKILGRANKNRNLVEVIDDGDRSTFKILDEIATEENPNNP
tara:strand:- start:18 stop:257 length:240 start_codon:yes stop_codon:yes gene_type:complete